MTGILARSVQVQEEATVKVLCFGHGPDEWINDDPTDAQEHEISEELAARFISCVTQGGYGEASMCVLNVDTSYMKGQP